MQPGNVSLVIGADVLDGVSKRASMSGEIRRERTAKALIERIKEKV
jgi:hypothetical protein